MVRVAVLDDDNVVTVVYELSHFVSLGLHEDENLRWEIDKAYKAFYGGVLEDGSFSPPPPCEDCMKNHQL